MQLSFFFFNSNSALLNQQLTLLSGTNSQSPGVMGKRDLCAQLCKIFRQSSTTAVSGFQKSSNRTEYEHLFKTRFVESSRGNRIYLTNDRVEEGSGCFAAVGYQGSPNQLLNLDPSKWQLQKIQSSKLYVNGYPSFN